MGVGQSSSSCCAQRDRNDKIVDIEFRNEMFFLFNYPALLKEIEKRVEETKEGVKEGDVVYFRRVA